MPYKSNKTNKCCACIYVRFSEFQAPCIDCVHNGRTKKDMFISGEKY